MRKDRFDISGHVAYYGLGPGHRFRPSPGLAEAGCSVVLNGRSLEALVRTREALAGTADGPVLARSFDASNPEQVAKEMAELEAEAGPLDIVVNNAGVERRWSFLGFSGEAWEELLRTNLTSARRAGGRAPDGQKGASNVVESRGRLPLLRWAYVHATTARLVTKVNN